MADYCWQDGVAYSLPSLLQGQRHVHSCARLKRSLSGPDHMQTAFAAAPHSMARWQWLLLLHNVCKPPPIRQCSCMLSAGHQAFPAGAAWHQGAKHSTSNMSGDNHASCTLP